MVNKWNHENQEIRENHQVQENHKNPENQKEQVITNGPSIKAKSHLRWDSSNNKNYILYFGGPIKTFSDILSIEKIWFL